MTLDPSALSVLLVGAGQVAIVLAHHLVRGGARVGFLIKPRHEAQVRQGFHLYPLNRPRAQRWQPVALEPTRYEVLTAPSQAASSKWDYVLLTQPSSGLRGEWFDELARACPQARFVTFQLGLGDREWIAERVAEERLMTGMLTLQTYLAPIADEPISQPGTAYWFPPGVPLPFRGPDPRAVDALVAVINAGGAAAVRLTSSRAGSRFPDFALMALIAALQLCNWKFSNLKANRDSVRLAIAATEESSAVDDRRLGTQRPFYYSFLTPTVMRAVLYVAARLSPLPLEAFLRVHFTKVNAQVARDRKLHIEEARKLGLPCGSLERLDELLSSAGPPLLDSAPRQD